MAEFTGTPTMAPTFTLQAHEWQKAKSTDTTAHVRMADSGVYTHEAGAGTGEVDLVELPPGKLKIYPDLSRVITSQFATGADLHIGYRAHTQADGTAVVEDDNAFLDNADAGGGALDSAFALPAGGVLELDSHDGVTIFAMVDTADIEDTDTIRVLVAYSRV